MKAIFLLPWAKVFSSPVERDSLEGTSGSILLIME
jgi:hypothetical protein